MNIIFNKTFLGFALVVLTITGLAWVLGDVTLYLVISVILASVLRTPTNYINQTQIYGVRIPRPIAILISFLILLFIASLFIGLFIPLISDQITLLSKIKFEEVMEAIFIPVEHLESFLSKIKYFDIEVGEIQLAIKTSAKNLMKDINLENFINNILATTSNIFIGLLAVMFILESKITFFILNEKGAVRKYFISLIPNKYFEVSIAAISKVEHLLSNYLLGLTIQMLSIFSIASVGLLIIGIDYAITISAFAAVANLIPFVGPLLGALFGIVVGLLTHIGTDSSIQSVFIMMFEIGIVFGIVQLSDNILLQPLIFSRSMKAHPLEIFLIIFVGANIAGAIGMVMAIPSYTIIKVSITEFLEGYKWYQIFRD